MKPARFPSRTALVAGLLLAVVSVLLPSILAKPASLPPPPPPGTRYVWASATAGNGLGTSWSNAFLRLEDAIAAANPGDMIWVAENSYSPPNQPNPVTGTRTYYVNKSLKIYGAFKGFELSLNGRQGLAENTILEGNIPASGGNVADHLFTIDTVSGTPGVLIDGFTIQHGNSTAGGGGFGGGIYSTRSDLDVTGCIIKENIGYYGGGLYFEGGPQSINTLHILSTRFVDNTVETDGGAMFGQHLTGDVVNTQFDTNSANHDGGAVYFWMMHEGNRLDFTNCTFWKNKCNNTAGGTTSSGGGVHMGEVSTAEVARARFVNCTFSKNMANGCLAGQAIFVSPNSVGEIYNSILYWNYGGSCSSATPPIGGAPTVDWSDVEGGVTPIAHNMNPPQDPLFRGGSPPTSGGQQLSLKGATTSQAGSPCIDYADWDWLPADHHDLDQDGVTTGEKIPVDLLESGRMIDRHGPLEDPNKGWPPPPPSGFDFLDMGAFEKP